MPTQKPAALTENERKQSFRLAEKAGENLSWTAGFLALPWLKLKPKTQFKRGEGAPTEWQISADGTFTFNPEWLQGARPDERVFSLAHGNMRFLLRHHDRGVDLGVVDPATGTAPDGKEHEHKLWGEACASVVNAPLQADKIGRAPAGSVFPEKSYAGSMDAESYYQYLIKTRPPPPPGGGEKPQGDGAQPPPSAGGQPTPPQAGQSEADPNAPGGQAPQGQSGGATAPLSADDIDQLRREVEALARQAGQGTATCNALRPKVVRSNFKAAIGAGMSDAQTEASERTTNTYSRANRREALLEGLIKPGKIGTDPTICVVLDASGSVSRDLLQKAASHCLRIATEFPNVRLYLVTHTSSVCFAEWLRAGGDVNRIMAATAHTGGTNFGCAYDQARRVAPRGKFDALVHFTDGYPNDDSWPMPPARRLIVGLCGAEELPEEPPIRAKVIPITEGEGRV